MDAGWTRLDLDLDLRGEPIAGQLALPGGSALSFTGYTGLIAAVEAIRDGEGATAPVSATDDVESPPAPRRAAL